MRICCYQQLHKGTGNQDSAAAVASRDAIGRFQGLGLIYNVLIGKLQAGAPMANDFRGILPLIKKLPSAGVETLQT